MIEKAEKKFLSPWLIIPTLYFAQGIPFIIVNQLSTALFKSMGVSNEFIGYTSFLYIPWSIKFLWSPLIDGRSTKRQWLITMQMILFIMFGLTALVLHLPGHIYILLGIFTLTAFISATHDIAIDGYYMYALDKDNQALFTGIRSTFYRAATIFSGGFLVYLAGTMSKNYGVETGWSVSMGIAGMIFLAIYVYHRFMLPRTEIEITKQEKSKLPFKEIFTIYFTQPKVWIIITFILTYRLGEGILLKMVQPFFLDDMSKGGLGLSLSEVGIYYGTFGIAALMIGGILGGWVVKKFSIWKVIFPLALIMHLANLLFVYMSITKPLTLLTLDVSLISYIFGGGNWLISFHPIVQICIIFEQFAYGLGFTSFMVYLLYVSDGKYKTSNYAISTGLMAFGMIVPGFLSGILQVNFGYTILFIISFLATIPGMIMIFFLPGEKEF